MHLSPQTIRLAAVLKYRSTAEYREQLGSLQKTWGGLGGTCRHTIRAQPPPWDLRRQPFNSCLVLLHVPSLLFLIQADICHCYHLLRRNGLKENNIIVMSYGDAADSEENPFPGKLFNKPTPEGVEGYDVNEGCVLDYKGENVTASNFLAVLTGDSKLTGNVARG